MKRRLRGPSPALVISLIALFVALGGTSYAALNLPKNSVGAKQLKKNAVTVTKIKNGSVTAAKINTKGLTVPNAKHATSADSATSATTATSATSATTATSATSATHASTADIATAIGTVSYQESAAFTAPACGASPCNGALSDTQGFEKCPAGTVVIAGGLTTSQAGVELNEGEPVASVSGGPLNEWFGFVDNFTTSARTFNIWAICVHAQTQTKGTAAHGTAGLAR